MPASSMPQQPGMKNQTHSPSCPITLNTFSELWLAFPPGFVRLWTDLQSSPLIYHPMLWGGALRSLGMACLFFLHLANPDAVFHFPQFGLCPRDFSPQPWGKANWLENSHFLPAIPSFVIEFPGEAILWEAAFV